MNVTSTKPSLTTTTARATIPHMDRKLASRPRSPLDRAERGPRPRSCRDGLIKSRRARGIEVRVELGDVADPDAVDGMLERIRAALPPVAGVIHSVGSLSDGSLTNEDWTRFERELWSKTVGA